MDAPLSRSSYLGGRRRMQIDLCKDTRQRQSPLLASQPRPTQQDDGTSRTSSKLDHFCAPSLSGSKIAPKWNDAVALSPTVNPLEARSAMTGTTALEARLTRARGRGAGTASRAPAPADCAARPRSDPGSAARPRPPSRPRRPPESPACQRINACYTFGRPGARVL
jgi:hypothetical protein